MGNNSWFTAKQKCAAISTAFYFAVLAVLLIGYLLTKDNNSYKDHDSFKDKHSTNGKGKDGEKDDQSNNVGEFIHNGTKVELGSFPWFVSIRSHVTYSPSCGGSIIEKEWVLTAKHCRMVNVFYETSGTLHNIVSFHYPPPNDILPLSDITLLRIAPPFDYRSQKGQYENAIAPIALPEAQTSFADQEGIIAGYGSTDVWSYVNPVTLLTAQVKIYHYKTCRKYWKTNEIESSNFVCAGDMKIATHACRGDSGGPLVTMRGETPILVGTAAHVSGTITGCFMEYGLAAYANVSSYVPWIKEVLQNNSQTLP